MTVTGQTAEHEPALRVPRRGPDPDPDRGSQVVESVLLRRILIVAHQIGLDRSDRLDLAEYLLGRRVASWGDLRVSEAERVRDALEGHLAVKFLTRGY